MRGYSPLLLHPDTVWFNLCTELLLSLFFCFLPLPPAGVQANEQYGEQFVVMFSLIMTQLKMVCVRALLV